MSESRLSLAVAMQLTCDRDAQQVSASGQRSERGGSSASNPSMLALQEKLGVPGTPMAPDADKDVLENPGEPESLTGPSQRGLEGFRVVGGVPGCRCTGNVDIDNRSVEYVC